eukprot:c29313_g3_i2 orf=284-1495(-)
MVGCKAMVTCECKRKRPSSVHLQSFRYRDLEEATRGFAAETLLGKGSHCSVYQGILGNGALVAVKRPSGGPRFLQDQDAFENEIQILSRVNNPRMVKLLGFCRDAKEKLLVVEFMPNGTLFDILHTSPEPLSWTMRLHLALQTAKAILVLHNVSPPIIHRDVKSSNILIDRDWNAKLGDFGLALSWQNGLSTPPAGTIGYLDPEYTTPEMLSPKNDVFSFGVLLLEIMSGRNAIDVRYSPPSILDWALPLIKTGKALAICDPRLGPPKSKSASKQLATLAIQCVRKRGAKRPNMTDIVVQLQQMNWNISCSVFTGITCKMHKTVPVVKEGQLALRNCRSPVFSLQSQRKCYQRNPKVCDGCPGDSRPTRVKGTTKKAIREPRDPRSSHTLGLDVDLLNLNPLN